jgi:hypothetical protein
MSPPRAAAAVAAALTILIGSGLAQGLWTGRWVSDARIKRAVAALQRLPLRFGEWEGTDTPGLSAELRERTGIAGSLHRQYVSRRDGAELSVLLVCGAPGPIATHPPEICLSGAGFTLAESPRPYRTSYGAPERAATFHAAEFDRPAPVGTTRMIVLWAWNGSGDWRTPASPRWTFAARPILYKLYVIGRLDRGGLPADGDAAHRLLRDLLPEIQPLLLTRAATLPESSRAAWSLARYAWESHPL